MSRQGQLLVAHPNLGDNTFKHSVVYVTEDHEGGTVGLMLNRPTEYSLREIMHTKGLELAGTDRVVYKGGPVNPTAVVMLHTDDWYSSNTMVVQPGVAISSDNFMIEKLALENAPSSWRIVLGVSGWAPGQLDREIDRGDWLQVATDPEILWGYDGEKQWRKSLDLCSQQMLAQYF